MCMGHQPQVWVAVTICVVRGEVCGLVGGCARGRVAEGAVLDFGVGLGAQEGVVLRVGEFVGCGKAETIRSSVGNVLGDDQYQGIRTCASLTRTLPQRLECSVP